ncbi:MAG: hypothetical protein ACJ790_22115 [Myxococcaceae bacterium]
MGELFIVGLVVALFALAALLRKSLRRGGGGRSAYLQLIKLADGDDELADRLIDAERKRNPGASRERLAQLALKRWEKDRGR